MRKLWKRIALLAVLTACLGLLAGCGKGAEKIVKRTALDYMKEKYDITPDVKDVVLKNSGDGGTVTMEAEGRLFDVEISLSDPAKCGDNFMKKEFNI